VTVVVAIKVAPEIAVEVTEAEGVIVEAVIVAVAAEDRQA